MGISDFWIACVCPVCGTELDDIRCDMVFDTAICYVECYDVCKKTYYHEGYSRWYDSQTQEPIVPNPAFRKTVKNRLEEEDNDDEYWT